MINLLRVEIKVDSTKPKSMDFDHLAHTIQDSDSVYVLYSCVDGRVNMVRVHVHVHVHESGDNIKGVKKKHD